MVVQGVVIQPILDYIFALLNNEAIESFQDVFKEISSLFRCPVGFYS